MNPWFRALLQLLILGVVIGGLLLFFPEAYAFAERAARELRYFWWLVLVVALGIWLVWGLGRKPKQ